MASIKTATVSMVPEMLVLTMTPAAAARALRHRQVRYGSSVFYSSCDAVVIDARARSASGRIEIGAHSVRLENPD